MAVVYLKIDNFFEQHVQEDGNAFPSYFLTKVATISLVIGGYNKSIESI